MRTKIISAFPGCGKTYFHKKYPKTTLDSDSSLFSWISKDENKIRNVNFPNNYIDHIKENIGKYEYIFVSSHKEVRDVLLDNCIFFYLVYPDISKKEIFIEKFKNRGSSENFIKLVSCNWEKWILELECCKIGCSNIKMNFVNLESEINNIICNQIRSEFDWI